MMLRCVGKEAAVRVRVRRAGGAGGEGGRCARGSFMRGRCGLHGRMGDGVHRGARKGRLECLCDGAEMRVKSR